MALVGDTLSIDEVREGVRELFKMYPGLKEEYTKVGIIIKEHDNSLYSKGGIKIEELPEIFEDCIGEYGFGTISIEKVLEWDERVLEGILSLQGSYDTHDECGSYYVGFVSEVGFDLENFVPRYNKDNSIIVKRLPSFVEECVNCLAVNGKLSTVSRLHMVNDTPVISHSKQKIGHTDFGLTDVILKWVRDIPIKDVYIILGEKDICEYVTKKNSDGEYTVTIF